MIFSYCTSDSERWNKYLETIVKVSTDPEYVKLWPEHIKQFKDIVSCLINTVLGSFLNNYQKRNLNFAKTTLVSLQNIVNSFDDTK